MKLRNKKTGEVVEAEGSLYYVEKDGQSCAKDCFESLAELNKEWEDYEKPKQSFWTIGREGTPIEYEFDFDGKFYEECDNKWVDKVKETGFYFETREEAERAVEKLKADTDSLANCMKDLELLFGG